MRISDWSSDVCSSDLLVDAPFDEDAALAERLPDAINGKFGILRQDLTIDRWGDQVSVSLAIVPLHRQPWAALLEVRVIEHHILLDRHQQLSNELTAQRESLRNLAHEVKNPLGGIRGAAQLLRSEEHTSELQSLMRSSYAVLCL